MKSPKNIAQQGPLAYNIFEASVLIICIILAGLLILGAYFFNIQNPDAAAAENAVKQVSKTIVKHESKTVVK
jgi:hypothetical protein